MLGSAGALILTTPCSEFVGRRAALALAGRRLPLGAWLRDRFYYEAHLHYFSRRSLEAALRRVGLDRVAGRRLPTDPQRASRKLGDSAVTRLVVWAGWFAVRVRLIAGNKWLFVARRPTDSEVNTSA
jgi:hypothetical protein